MVDRNKITDALMRMFTPETAGQNFGSPQDDPEGWARAVEYQGRLRDATQEGMDMPPDPRAEGWRGSERRAAIDNPQMAANKPKPSPYPAPGQPWPAPRGAPGPLLPPLPWQPPDWT